MLEKLLPEVTPQKTPVNTHEGEALLVWGVWKNLPEIPTHWAPENTHWGEHPQVLLQARPNHMPVNSHWEALQMWRFDRSFCMKLHPPVHQRTHSGKTSWNVTNVGRPFVWSQTSSTASGTHGEKHTNVGGVAILYEVCPPSPSADTHGEKPSECPECAKAFCKKSALTVQVIHTRTLPQAVTCGLSLSHQRGLRSKRECNQVCVNSAALENSRIQGYGLSMNKMNMGNLCFES
jgi:hypothetical protein